MAFGRYSCSCCNAASDTSNRAFYIRLLPLGEYMILCDRCMKHRNRYTAEELTVWDLVLEAHRNGALSPLFIIRTTEVATERVLVRLRNVFRSGVGKLRSLAQEMSHYWERCAVSLRERLWGGH